MLGRIYMGMLGLNVALHSFLFYKIVTTDNRPLHIAAAKGDLEAIFHWKDAGNVNIQAGKNGVTPMHTAAALGNVEAIRTLESLGGNINTADLLYVTPIHAAAFNGRLGAIKTLWDLGANIDMANIDGETPLYTAACRGNFDVVNFLLQAGANPRITTVKTDTPLKCAKRSRTTQEVQMVINLLERSIVQSPTAVKAEIQNPPILMQYPQSSDTFCTETIDNKPVSALMI